MGKAKPAKGYRQKEHGLLMLANKNKKAGYFNEFLQESRRQSYIAAYRMA
jgi:hypothetical protein